MKRRIFSLLCLVLCVLLCGCAVIVGNDTDTADAITKDTATQSESQTTQDSPQSDAATDSVSDVINGTESDAVTDVTGDETTKDQDNSTTPSDDPVKLVMVGDVLMHDPVLDSGKLQGGGYSYKHLFDNVADVVGAADIAMFNQEVIIAGEKYGIDGYPRFNAPFELADAIAAVGFDVAVHATNHTLDVGKAAMLDCLNYWGTKYPDIEVVGMHDSPADAEKISIVEKNGIKIAILNYTYTVNGAGTAALAASPYLVDILDENRIRRDVKAADELADFVIVAAHWGTEYTHKPSTSQKKWAKLMLECGVDLVLGTHPHVIQPVEWMEDDQGNKMLVYWSLGNFINSTGETGKGKGARMLGAMADVELSRDEKGEVYISSAYAVPLVTHIKYQTYGITTYKFSDYTEAMLAESEAVRIDSTFTYQYCVDTFEEILGKFLKK